MKIIIDPGHGGIARGATFQGVDEADINLLVSLCLEKILLDKGFDVSLTRCTDNDVSLKDRVDFSNEINANLFLSIHCNADPDNDELGTLEAKGEEIWIYEGSRLSKKIAENLSKKVDKIFDGNRFRGIKETKSLYVLRETDMPAVLIELGFIDNVEEMKFLSHPASYIRIANLIAEGLVDIYGR